MIKVKLEQLVNSINALDKLGNMPLDSILAYKFGKTIQTVSNQLQLYEKTRQQLLEKYCVKDDNGQVIIDDKGNVQIKQEYIKNYNDEIKKINALDLELNIIPWEFDDLKNIKLTPKEIISIEWAIKKEEG